MREAYLANNRVNRSVDSKRLSDDVIQYGKVLEIFVGHVTERAVRVAKLFLLLLVEFLPAQLSVLVITVRTINLTYVGSLGEVKQCP